MILGVLPVCDQAVTGGVTGLSLGVLLGVFPGCYSGCYSGCCLSVDKLLWCFAEKWSMHVCANKHAQPTTASIDPCCGETHDIFG